MSQNNHILLIWYYHFGEYVQGYNSKEKKKLLTTGIGLLTTEHYE